MIFLSFIFIEFYSTCFRFKPIRLGSFPLLLLWFWFIIIFYPLQFILISLLSSNIFKWWSLLNFSKVLNFWLNMITLGCTRFSSWIQSARYFFGHATMIQVEEILADFIIIKRLKTALINFTFILIVRSFLIWKWFEILLEKFRIFWRLKSPQINFLLPTFMRIFLNC
jgi:hypothetical protein